MNKKVYQATLTCNDELISGDIIEIINIYIPNAGAPEHCTVKIAADSIDAIKVINKDGIVRTPYEAENGIIKSWAHRKNKKLKAV